MVICLERGADLHMAQLIPLPLSLASVKSRLVLPFWYRLTQVVLDKGPLNVCVCTTLLLSPVSRQPPSIHRRHCGLQADCKTHTHTRLTAYTGRPVPEVTLTHSHPSWSMDILYHLPPFTTIYSIIYVQFTCLTVLSDNLSPGPLWSSSWSWTLYFILHAFLHPVIIFFAAHAHTNADRL